MAYVNELSGRKLRQTLGSNVHVNESVSAPVTDFARQQLEKMGWKDGDGLGKHHQGISTHIKVKKRTEEVGLGHAGNNTTPEALAVVEPQDAWWKNGMGDVFAKLNKTKGDTSSSSTATTTSSRNNSTTNISDEALFAATGGARFGMRARRKQVAKWSRSEVVLSEQEEIEARSKVEWNGRGKARIVLSEGKNNNSKGGGVAVVSKTTTTMTSEKNEKKTENDIPKEEKMKDDDDQEEEKKNQSKKKSEKKNNFVVFVGNGGKARMSMYTPRKPLAIGNRSKAVVSSKEEEEIETHSKIKWNERDKSQVVSGLAGNNNKGGGGGGGVTKTTTTDNMKNEKTENDTPKEEKMKDDDDQEEEKKNQSKKESEKKNNFVVFVGNGGKARMSMYTPRKPLAIGNRSKAVVSSKEEEEIETHSKIKWNERDKSQVVSGLAGNNNKGGGGGGGVTKTTTTDNMKNEKTENDTPKEEKMKDDDDQEEEKKNQSKKESEKKNNFVVFVGNGGKARMSMYTPRKPLAIGNRSKAVVSSKEEEEIETHSKIKWNERDKSQVVSGLAGNNNKGGGGGVTKTTTTDNMTTEKKNENDIPKDEKMKDDDQEEKKKTKKKKNKKRRKEEQDIFDSLIPTSTTETTTTTEQEQPRKKKHKKESGNEKKNDVVEIPTVVDETSSDKKKKKNKKKRKMEE